MSGFFDSIGKAIGDAARYMSDDIDAQQAAGELLEMSEPAGMKHLREIVPSMVENGHMTNFLFLLDLKEKNTSADYGDRVNAESPAFGRGFLYAAAVRRPSSRRGPSAVGTFSARTFPDPGGRGAPASSPASWCRRPRLFRGSGTWARSSTRYWLRVAVIGEDVIGGGRPSWQKMASAGASIVPPGHCPRPEGTPDTSSTVRASQVTASRHDFAVSLLGHRGSGTPAFAGIAIR